MIKSYVTVLEYKEGGRVKVEINLNGKIKKFIRTIKKIDGQNYIVINKNEYLV